jgi:hypothetical protein
LRQRVEFREQFRFAEVTAIGRIRRVLRIVEFLCFNDLNAQPDLLCQGQRLGQRRAWQTRAIGDNAKHAVPERRMGFRKQVRAVHAAAVGNHQWRVGAKQRPELIELFHEIGGAS